MKALLPIDKMCISRPGIALNRYSPTRVTLAKRMVLDEIPENGVIDEHSQEQHVYGADAPLGIHEETVGVDPDSGKAEAYVNARRFGALSEQL